MRNQLKLLPVLLLASCGQGGEQSETSTTDAQAGNMTTSDIVDSASPNGPGVNITAAPGVAFNYRYAFRLPSNRIAGVQERHAQMCEALGLARCRITGMRYRLENERDISAMLELKLDPSIARNFGKSATAVVSKSDGMLVDQEISGVDAGAAITQANSSEAGIRDDIAKIETELRRPGLSNIVRDRLLAEVADLRTQIRSVGATRAADRESLARTPMLFNYGSGSLIPGFDSTSPIRDAIGGASANFAGAIAFIVTLLAALLPWVLLLALGLWIARRFFPARFGPRRASAAERGTEPPLDPI